MVTVAVRLKGTQAAGVLTMPGMWVARVNVLRKVGLTLCLANHPEHVYSGQM
jgi:hypothetical protein